MSTAGAGANSAMMAGVASSAGRSAGNGMSACDGRSACGAPAARIELFSSMVTCASCASALPVPAAAAIRASDTLDDKAHRRGSRMLRRMGIEPYAGRRQSTRRQRRWQAGDQAGSCGTSGAKRPMAYPQQDSCRIGVALALVAKAELLELAIEGRAADAELARHLRHVAAVMVEREADRPRSSISASGRTSPVSSMRRSRVGSRRSMSAGVSRSIASTAAAASGTGAGRAACATSKPLDLRGDLREFGGAQLVAVGRARRRGTRRSRAAGHCPASRSWRAGRAPRRRCRGCACPPRPRSAATKRRARSGMSSRRSRSGGMVIGKTLSR